MKDIDIAIGILDKLIAREREAANNGMRMGNRILEENASARYHAYIMARDEIRDALATNGREERDGMRENPFRCQRDELTTSDMHTCDLCGRMVPSPVYSMLLAYGGQFKTATEVCADCMWHLKFQPVKAIPLETYRLFEQWHLTQSEDDE
jgi:hypothetical protein